MDNLQYVPFSPANGLLPSQGDVIGRRRPVRAAILGCITIAFALLLTWIALAANSGQAEPLYVLLRRIPWGDKLFHLLAAGILAFLLNLTLAGRKVRIGPTSLFLASVLLVPLVTVEEFSQLWLQHRVFSLMDLAFNFLGIVMFGRLAVGWRSKSTSGAVVDATAHPLGGVSW